MESLRSDLSIEAFSLRMGFHLRSMALIAVGTYFGQHYSLSPSVCFSALYTNDICFLEVSPYNSFALHFLIYFLWSGSIVITLGFCPIVYTTLCNWKLL